MSDEYIKKDDAIEAVRGLSVLVDDEDFSYFEDRIKALPPADVVERKRGEWISLHNGKWKCSECGIEVLIYAKGNFCPNCGADMEKARTSDGSI